MVLLAVPDPPSVAAMSRVLLGLPQPARLEVTSTTYETLLRLGTLAPDLAVIDLNLPGLDAPRLWQELERDSRLRALRVIALVDAPRRAMAQALDRERGRDAVVTRPLRASEFEKVVLRLLDIRT